MKAPAEDSPLRREIVVASAAVLVGLGTIKHVSALVPAAAGALASVAIAAQLYAPLLRAPREEPVLEALGVRFRRWRIDMVQVVLAVLVVTPIYGWAYGQWFSWAGPFRLRFPTGFAWEFVTQTLVIALAEEAFFRGYLQRLWVRLDPGGWVVAGIPWRPIAATSMVFGLAHVVGEYVPARMGPALPSLLFGAMAFRARSIAGATVFHAYCNALADIVRASYRP